MEDDEDAGLLGGGVFSGDGGARSAAGAEAEVVKGPSETLHAHLALVDGDDDAPEVPGRHGQAKRSGEVVRREIDESYVDLRIESQLLDYWSEFVELPLEQKGWTLITVER